MNDKKKFELDEAIAAMRNDEPSGDELQRAGMRVWSRLAAAETTAAVEQIRGCEDVRAVLPAYRGGTLAHAKALIVRDHLRECVDCAKRARMEPQRDTSWAAPVAPQRFGFRWPQLAMAAAAVAVIAVAALILNATYFAAPEGYRAKVQSVDGTVYRVSDNGERVLAVGEEIAEGERLRAAVGSHAFVELRDGSVVEVNGGAEFAVRMTRRNTTVDLDRGNIIVQAAKRRTGHLYVATPDANVSVTGTVFAVNSGTKGSRVSVVEGEVHVEHGGTENVLHSGDQVATSDNLGRVSVADEIAWSRNREKHLALMAEFAALRSKLAQIAEPAPRFSSNIVGRIPANTLLYVSIPNIGEMIGEADRIFREQMAQSPTLQEWWAASHKDGTAEFDRVVAMVRELSEYVGDEVVITMYPATPSTEPSFVMIAEVTRTGLGDFLKSKTAEFTKPGQKADFHVLDEHAAMTGTPAMYKGSALAVVRDDMVAFSPNIAVLQKAIAQWNTGTSEFPASGLGQRVSQAYSRGAGFLLAADIQQLTKDTQRAARKTTAQRRDDASLKQSGLGEVRYLIAEHRELNGKPDNRAVLEFAGERRGIASWLAAPAPMRSLEFVSRNAGLAVSVVPKDPALMFDDMLAIDAADGTKHDNDLAKAEAELGVNLRNDLAAAFGSDVTFALDGPVLPTPSWKVIGQVNDPARVQAALTKLVEFGNREAAKHGKQGGRLEQANESGRTFFTIRALDPKALQKEIHYTFADGYIVIAPTRALLYAALRTKANGDSLARSGDFRATLPSDNNPNCSGLLYQNLSPMMEPLGSVLSGDQAQMLQTLARDAKPSTICAYGEPSAITLASNSRLLEMNPLSLPFMFGNSPEHRKGAVRKQR